MSYINTLTKKDITLERMGNLGGKRTMREWAKLIGMEPKDISNAMASEPDLKERYIILERNRPIGRMPVKKIIKKLENARVQWGKEKFTRIEIAKITGYNTEQVGSLVTRHQKLKEFYITEIDEKYNRVLVLIEKSYLGFPRFIEDWVALTGLDRMEIVCRRTRLEEHFGAELFIYKTDVRVEEIHALAGKLTLTEWAKRYDLEISAMHHFFTRKGLHHLRKNPPKKYCENIAKIV